MYHRELWWLLAFSFALIVGCISVWQEFRKTRRLQDPTSSDSIEARKVLSHLSKEDREWVIAALIHQAELAAISRIRLKLPGTTKQLAKDAIQALKNEFPCA